MLRLLLVVTTALLATTSAQLAPNSDPNTLSLGQFLDASARDLFPKDAVDELQTKFRGLMLYMFDRYPTSQSKVQHLPTMLREGRISSGAALDYWVERTMALAREHAYKHIEKSYWAEQQKLEYNMLGKEFANIEQAAHGLANLRFEPEHVAFFTDFIREYMKKPAAQTATVNDFVREFKQYVKTVEAVQQSEMSNSNGTGDVKAYRTFRSFGPFDMFFDLTSKVTDAFYSMQKMMGPLRTIGAFIPGIGCTLNALNTVACVFNQNTGIGALLNGRIGVFDLARCSLHSFSSIARGIDGVRLSIKMLKEFMVSVSGGGGVQAGVSGALNILKESNINDDPWVDIGVADWVPGHDSISTSYTVVDTSGILSSALTTVVNSALNGTAGTNATEQAVGEHSKNASSASSKVITTVTTVTTNTVSNSAAANTATNTATANAEADSGPATALTGAIATGL